MRASWPARVRETSRGKALQHRAAQAELPFEARAPQRRAHLFLTIAGPVADLNAFIDAG